MELSFDPVISLLGIYTKNPETLVQKNLSTPMFIAAQFTIAKWMKKQWYIYTIEYYEAERKKELLLIMTAWMEMESMLSEISQAMKDKYHMISPVSGT